MTSVLVLSDTHLGPGRGGELLDILGDRLERADLVVHAGDIVSRDVVECLARHAPVTAVKGNNDTELELPSTAVIRVGACLVGVVHDSGAATGRAGRLTRMFPEADVVVFGHSHLPWNLIVDAGGRQQHHFNPGSPTQRRRAPTRSIGWIDIDADDIGAHGIRCRHEHL